MASAQVVETSVTNISPSQDSNHPDDLLQSKLSIRVSQSKRMQVETIYTFKNYLYVVTSGFFSQNKVEKICLIYFGRFYRTIIPLALVGFEMIIANEARSAELAIYHLISNKREWNDC